MSLVAPVGGALVTVAWVLVARSAPRAWASFCWLVALATFTWLVGHASSLALMTPAPGVHAVADLAFVVVWAVAVLRCPVWAWRREPRSGLAIDGLIVVGAGGAVVLAVGGSDSGLAQAVAGAYAVAGLGLLILFVSLAGAAIKTHARPVALYLAAGAVIGVLGVWARTDPAVSLPRDLRPVWSGLFVAVLVALAALAFVSSGRDEPAEPISGSPALAALVAIVAVALRSGARSAALITVVVTLLAVTRLALLLAAQDRLADQLRDRLDEMETKEVSRWWLIATIAHDVRSPLTGIAAFSAHLRRSRNHDEAGISALDAIDSNVERANQLVNDLMQASQSPAEPTPDVALRPVDLLAFARQTLDELDLRRHVTLVGEGVTVFADPRRLYQIAANLLQNARRHAPDAWIGVRVNRTADEGFVEIRDAGPGLPGEDVERLFEPFVHGDVETAGSGLGLSTVRALTEAMNGRVEVSDVPAGGTRFRILFPLADSRAASGFVHGVGPAVSDDPS